MVPGAGDGIADHFSAGEISARVRAGVVHHHNAARLIEQKDGQFASVVLHECPGPFPALAYGDYFGETHGYFFRSSVAHNYAHRILQAICRAGTIGRVVTPKGVSKARSLV